MVSVRKRLELPLCRTESFPDGSKMGPPLVKAELISDVGSTSVITY